MNVVCERKCLKPDKWIVSWCQWRHFRPLCSRDSLHFILLPLISRSWPLFVSAFSACSFRPTPHLFFFSSFSIFLHSCSPLPKSLPSLLLSPLRLTLFRTHFGERAKTFFFHLCADYFLLAHYLVCRRAIPLYGLSLLCSIVGHFNSVSININWLQTFPFHVVRSVLFNLPSIKRKSPLVAPLSVPLVRERANEAKAIYMITQINRCRAHTKAHTVRAFLCIWRHLYIVCIASISPVVFSCHCTRREQRTTRSFIHPRPECAIFPFHSSGIIRKA